jgi:hypothetical protein
MQLDRTVEYKGEQYRVVEALENYLLLVVKKSDIDEEKFPLRTVVIPDLSTIEALTEMKKANRY